MSERTIDSSAYWLSEAFAGRLARVAFLVNKLRAGRAVDAAELTAAIAAGLEAIDAVAEILAGSDEPRLPPDAATAILRLVDDGRGSHAYLAEDVGELRERLTQGVEALRRADIDLLGTLAEQASQGAARAYRRLRRR